MPRICRIILFLIFPIAHFSKAQENEISSKYTINVFSNLVVNKSLSNLTYRRANTQYPYRYTRDASTPLCFGLSAGLEGTKRLGDTWNWLLALNYELTHSVLVAIIANGQRTGAMASYKADTGYITINRQVQAVGINSGFLAEIGPRFHLSLVLGINEIIRRRDLLNGYEKQYSSSSISTATVNEITYNNEKRVDRAESEEFVLYGRVRVGYKVFPYLSVTASYTQSFNYVAPWLMLGVQYYPFQKFR
jgi:hypothetical protein